MVKPYETSRMTSLFGVFFCGEYHMNCLFWNIHGIRKGEKSMSIRNIVDKKKVTFMGLVETKHKRLIGCRMKRMWGSDD